MNDVLKEIKDSWDQLSDSAWYRSLRTDGKIAELMEAFWAKSSGRQDGKEIPETENSWSPALLLSPQPGS